MKGECAEACGIGCSAAWTYWCPEVHKETVRCLDTDSCSLCHRSIGPKLFHHSCASRAPLSPDKAPGAYVRQQLCWISDWSLDDWAHPGHWGNHVASSDQGCSGCLSTISHHEQIASRISWAQNPWIQARLHQLLAQCVQNAQWYDRVASKPSPHSKGHPRLLSHLGRNATLLSQRSFEYQRSRWRCGRSDQCKELALGDGLRNPFATALSIGHHN
mmetsp:Transcript_3996/g.7163  ORF Transcript_3996/g.7163 Transcript_3996/m.7163 type:complete len:216 (-) Transcript_3996:407-1054(-)